ncbi:FtsX-like permease family protein [Nonomuraea sp. NPDC049028]|uniref:FtsX-like permease family protein n=1 Tax=Nonomuraea sp. NPDC049028 TaxID=3364348 RepID=UPI00371040AA
MLRLTLSTIRTRKIGFAGSVASVLVAVALISACFMMIQSGLSATPEVDRFGATAAVVRADTDLHVGSGDDEEAVPLEEPPRLSAARLAELRAVPGVADVVADTPFYAQAVDRHGAALAGPGSGPSWGHGWPVARLTPFVLNAGRGPEADDEVVLDADLARRASVRPGDEVRVVTVAGTQRFRVSGVARLDSGRAGLPTQSALFFTERAAARLSGADGSVEFAGVLARPGISGAELADRLRQTLRDPGLRVLTGGERARAGAPETAEKLEYSTQLFGPMAGIGGFLAVFVIGGTFGLSILQRRREIALLRAIGTTPGQISRMIAGEAVVVALVAALPGYALGVPLARLLRAVLVGQGLAPPEFVVVTGPLPLVIGGGAGLLLTLLSALTAVRQAARVRPAEALQEAVGPRRVMTVPRLLFALVMLAGGAAVLALSQHLGGEVGVAFLALVVILFIGAAGLLSPVLTRVLEGPAGAVVGAVTRTTGWLAHANSAAAVRRVSSAAAAIMISVAMAGYALLVTAVLNDTSAAQGRERVVADRVLVPRNGPGLPPGVADTARRLPGAETVSAVRATSFVSYVLGTPDVVPAQLVDPGTIGKVLDLRVLEGSLAAVKEAGTVAVSRTHAGEHGWHVGSRFHGWLADGSPVDLRVGAVFDRGLGFADIVLPRTEARTEARAGAQTGVRAGVRAGLDSAVLVRARPGHADELDRALAAFEREQPAVRALDREEYGGAAETSIERNITGTYLVLAVLVSFTAVSLVNTLVMGTAARTREFALLRAVGASRRQIVRMIGWETGIVLAIGVVVGTVIACVALAGANGALSGSMMLTGLPMPLYPLVLAGVAVMGLASGLLAAGMALLSRPMDALGGARE